jgi:transcriptional regulator with XRE-family HTH domain
MSESRPVTQPAAISATIRRLRRERGLTQDALAQAVGVSSQAVSKWETGQAMPDITLLLSLSKELQVGVNELLGGQRREELMQQFMHATTFGEESILMACEEALAEFPDDELFLRSRADALLQIGAKKIMRREEWIRMAIDEFYLLSSKYPDNPAYTAKMAEGYAMLGDRERALSTMLQYSGPGKEIWMEPFLDEETRITKKQKNIKNCLLQLYEALEEYGTKESLAAAHTLLDSLVGDEKKFIAPTMWSLSMREAILCRDAGDDEGFVAHLTKAYEQSREVDRAFRVKNEQISYQNSLFDRLPYGLADINNCVCGTFLFLNHHHDLFAHPTAVGLKKRILDEMVRCVRLENYMFLDYLQFCIGHINFPNYFNYSICWDINEEEEMAMEEECMHHPLYGKYRSVVWQSICQREAERMCRDGIMKGYVASHYNDIIAFCNCKEKSKYKRLPIPAELSADAAPEGAKILAIVEMLISRDYRDCGLEEKLLDNVLTDAKRQGYTHVQAHLMEDCLPELFEKRIDCFLKLGFAIICDTTVKHRIFGDIEYSNRRSCMLQKEI